ncbi:MAG: hypothetical protein J6R12_08190 [Bacteroidales bacterium]|nr:hypothetical protein [Bacteroidales bacterium]
MQKIKTVQPYKLYAKLAEAKPSVRKSFIWGIVVIIGAILYKPEMLLVTIMLIAIALPTAMYDPLLKPFYQPKESYSSIRDSAQGLPPRYLTKFLPIIGIISGICMDVIMGGFPILTLGLGVCLSLMAVIIKLFPNIVLNQHFKNQMKYHKDIDYNAKVDLSVTYGVNDRLFLSYQNFNSNQQKLENGDFIFGVSPLGIYFAHKMGKVEKLFIKYDEIDTMGVLLGIGNVLIFNVKSIHNNELNIIIDDNESFVVSPYKIFDKLLTTVDEFLLNGSVASATVERRRRVVTTPSTVIATTPRVESSTSGRAIDMDTTTETINESSEDANKRVVDIEFTPEVVEELAQGSFIEANRSIDVF